VTHLPQIAAYADTHLRIEKLTRDGRTVTRVAELDGEERTNELAAMLGGAQGSTGAMSAAAELLMRAGELHRQTSAVGA
jgi:DNA repair protein RecN (Recombination protein N)